jgi:hypothetical protein
MSVPQSTRSWYRSRKARTFSRGWRIRSGILAAVSTAKCGNLVHVVLHAAQVATDDA